MLTDETRTTKVVCQPNADKGMGGGRGAGTGRKRGGAVQPDKGTGGRRWDRSIVSERTEARR